VCESCGAFGTLHWRAPGTYGHVLPPEPKAVLGMTTMNTVSGG
jgi:HemY protein